MLFGNCKACRCGRSERALELVNEIPSGISKKGEGEPGSGIYMGAKICRSDGRGGKTYVY